MKNNKWIVLISLLVTLTNVTAFAADEMSTEQRLERLERLVNNQGLVDVMVRVESIQSELQRLLGEIELQKHTLDEIKKRQRDLYLDIDRRLLHVERRSGSSARRLTPEITSRPLAQSENTESTSAEKSSYETTAAPAMKNNEGEQVAYQNAFDLLRAQRYDKATQAFRQFLTEYPDGRYAHIAQYWLAETSYYTKKYDIAINDYQTLIAQYPKSPKRADALLKIGYSQFELKAFSKSKSILNKLIKSYPGTTEAGQAVNLIQKIRLQKTQ